MTGADLIRIIKEKKLEDCKLTTHWINEDQDIEEGLQLCFEGTEKFPEGCLLLLDDDESELLLCSMHGFKRMIDSETLKED